MGFQTLRKIQAPIMVKMVSPKMGECILDAGCGSGYMSLELGKNLNIVAVDISRDRVKEAKTRLTQLGHQGFFVVCSVTNLSFKSNVFDKVLLSSVLQHVKDPLRVLKEINCGLRAEGIFVINVPSDRPFLYLPSFFGNKFSSIEEFLWNSFKAHHKWSTDDMKEMLGMSGFEVLSLEYSPKYIAAFFYEMGLLFTLIVSERIARRLLFIAAPAIYLISEIDYLLPRDTGGSEFIIKARKLLRKTVR